MMFDAVLAYLHYLAFILLFVTLSIEAVLLGRPLTPTGVAIITRLDRFYGGAAALTLVTGLMRVFMGPKGAAFYSGNPVFHAKVALFVFVGLLSISPTLKFLRWAKRLAADPGFTPDPVEQKKARRVAMVQLHLAALIPLLAALMARGIGY